MAKYLIDANLPFHISVWKNDEFIHLFDINDSWTDREIWEYAKRRGMTIITKDSDFSNWIITKEPPPKVIHLRIGNMRLKLFNDFITKNWKEIVKLSNNHKLVTVYAEFIEAS